MTAEAITRKLYELAGIGQVSDEGVGQLARALLGAGGIVYADIDDHVQLDEGPWRLSLALDLSDEDLTVGVALGLARWWLATHPEDACEVSPAVLALWIALPPDALREAAARLGNNVNEIAAEFVVSPELAAHRLRSMPASPARRSGTRPRFRVA